VSGPKCFRTPGLPPHRSCPGLRCLGHRRFVSSAYRLSNQLAVERGSTSWDPEALVLGARYVPVPFGHGPEPASVPQSADITAAIQRRLGA